MSGGVLAAEEDGRLLGSAGYCPGRDDDTGPRETGTITGLRYRKSLARP